LPGPSKGATLNIELWKASKRGKKSKMSTSAKAEEGYEELHHEDTPLSPGGD